MDVQQQQAMQQELENARQQVADMQARLARGTQEATAEIATAHHRLLEEQERANRTTADWDRMSRTFVEAINTTRDDRERRPKGEPKPTFKKEPGEDYLIFQQHFEVWAGLQGLSDDNKKKSLFTAFQGNAGRVARIFGPDSEPWKKPYAGYEADVRSVFASKAESEAAKSTFEVRTQGKGESCQEYAAEKMALFLVAYPAHADKTLLVREYIRGLVNPEIKKMVVRHAGVGFQQVVDHANNEEAAIIYLASLNRYERSHAPPAIAFQPQPVHRAAPEAMDLSDMMAAMGRGGRDQYGRFSARGRGGGRDGPRDGCWVCGDPNHFRRECPNKARDGAGGPAQRGAARGGGRGGRGGPARGARGGGGAGRGGGWGNSANHRWRHFAAMFNDFANKGFDDNGDMDEHYYDAATEPQKELTGPDGAGRKEDF